MTLRIFISHSFDHPDKLRRVLEFLRMRGVKHIDCSVPVWDQLNDQDPQPEIERRISACDRVLVIMTENCHTSDWINQEIAWARQYTKPVIAVWPHGEAGSPIPRQVHEANAHLIGWRATSLEKAIKLQDVGDYRALDLAENADFDRAVRRVVTATGAISLLLIGYQFNHARRLQRELRSHGIDVKLVDNPWPMVRRVAVGAAIGAALMAVVGWLFGRTRGQPAKLAALGAAAGAGLGMHRHMKVRIQQYAALTVMEFEQPKQLPAAATE